MAPPINSFVYLARQTVSAK